MAAFRNRTIQGTRLPCCRHSLKHGYIPDNLRLHQKVHPLRWNQMLMAKHFFLCLKFQASLNLKIMQIGHSRQCPKAIFLLIFTHFQIWAYMVSNWSTCKLWACGLAFECIWFLKKCQVNVRERRHLLRRTVKFWSNTTYSDLLLAIIPILLMSSSPKAFCIGLPITFKIIS